MELRPLGFGEIFDRAVTLYIRNFVPFASIVLVMVVPLAFFQYFIARGTQGEFDALIHIFTHPRENPPQQVPMLWNSPGVLAAYVGVFVVAFVLSPFVLNAVAVGVARLYRNLPVDFRACYSVVLRRWKQILGVMVLELCALVAWYVAVLLATLGVILIVGFVYTAAPLLAVAFAVLVGIAATLAFVALLAALVVALAFSMYGTIIEERGVLDALKQGFSRVFNRGEFWRALLFAIAYCAVVAGASMTFSAVSLVATLFHQPALRAVIDAISQGLISPFGGVLMAVYYFDVRIRHEAFDLEAGLDRLTGPAIA